ncbi:GntR family transcriptional regulator [Nonomuraea sp. NPDC000554]|uniref:GntR family transcriptional regulator n=1 Tax=Nonomuraea sp. NPDC000554 TaxID=3154259 RepID=UPI00331B9CFF
MTPVGIAGLSEEGSSAATDRPRIGAARLGRRLMAGRRAGDRQEFELSRITIKKALDVLKSENLIETAPGRGLFVKDHRAN